MAELVFFSGTMDCGKSTLALQMDHNNSVRGRQGLIFTKLDRMGESVLSSRLGLSTPAIEVDDDLDFWDEVVERLTAGARVDYLICDEAQFYTPGQVEQLARVVDELGIDVHAFGITADFRTELFPGSRRLIELADRVQLLQVEALCWCGRKATHNARIVDGVMVVEGEQVVVGDTAAASTGLVEYEVLCRRHYMRRMNSHAARAASPSPDTLPFDLDVCAVPPARLEKSTLDALSSIEVEVHPDAGPELGGHLTIALEPDPGVEGARVGVAGHLEACAPSRRARSAASATRGHRCPCPGGRARRRGPPAHGPGRCRRRREAHDRAVGGDGDPGATGEHPGVREHEHLGVGEEGRARRRGSTVRAPEDLTQRREVVGDGGAHAHGGPVRRSRRRGCRRRCRPSSARWDVPCGRAAGAGGAAGVAPTRARRRGRGVAPAPGVSSSGQPPTTSSAAVGSSRWAETGLRARDGRGRRSLPGVDGEVLDGQRVGPRALVARGVRRGGAAAPSPAGAVLAHRGHEVDRLVRRAVEHGDARPRRGRRCRRRRGRRRGAPGAVSGWLPARPPR